MRNKKIIGVLNLILLVILVAVQLWPGLAFAQTRAEAAQTGFERICSTKDEQGRPITGALPNCISKIYLFSLGAGALIALLMVVLAGYRYMTAGGNAEQVSAAKESLESAFKGLIIIFVGFILLYLINPDLVQFKNALNLPNLMPAKSSSTTPTASGISIAGINSPPTYSRGATVSISFSPVPAGANFTWSLVGGNASLPTGLTFTASPPGIAGTITQNAIVKTYNLNIRASDSAGQIKALPFTITVR